jgi:hypothetical protein
MPYFLSDCKRELRIISKKEGFLKEMEYLINSVKFDLVSTKKLI